MLRRFGLASLAVLAGCSASTAPPTAIDAGGDDTSIVSDTSITDSRRDDTNVALDTNVADTAKPDTFMPPAGCSNGMKDGTETDSDCGGSVCPKCANGRTCVFASDCASAYCKDLVCAAPSCTDGAKNGTETDVDCGGTCTARCVDGLSCGAGADCASGICSTGKCVPVSCADGFAHGSATSAATTWRGRSTVRGSRRSTASACGC